MGYIYVIENDVNNKVGYCRGIESNLHYSRHWNKGGIIKK